MLRLSQEQLERLEQIALKRHAATISSVLAETWPALTERLQDRWPAFVEAAVQQGRKLGLADPRELARYASLWCIWGPSFDSKPAFAWAAEILADPRRSTSLKLHQLAHRTRDELGRRTPAGAGAAPTVTSAQFDAALAALDVRIGVLAAARSVFPPAGVVDAVRPCDVGSIDMMVAEVENLKEYRAAANGWQRLAVGRANEPAVKWTHAPEVPVALAVTSHAPRDGSPARLNLIVDTVAVCDARTHPEVVYVGVEGRLAWKGRDAARLSLPLYLPPPTAGAPAPAVAAEAPPVVQSVRIAGCGVRNAGAPFGDVAIALQVYPATQWLTEVQHPAPPPMAWPAEAGAGAPAPSTATCRLERDGEAADALPWQNAWRGLHVAFRQGMERLFNEWARALDSASARLEVEASPLVGQAGFGWGWRRTSAATVAMRTQGTIDMLALGIELRLSGEVADGGARSRIRIQASGRSELRQTIAQLGDEAREEQGLAAARRTWRYPLTLEVEPIAGPEPATLVAAAGPAAISGALVGECGLRPRPDGAGYGWFFALRIEPVTVTLETTDPLVGGARQVRPLVPATSLVEWSAG